MNKIQVGGLGWPPTSIKCRVGTGTNLLCETLVENYRTSIACMHMESRVSRHLNTKQEEFGRS